MQVIKICMLICKTFQISCNLKYVCIKQNVFFSKLLLTYPFLNVFTHDRGSKENSQQVESK